MQLNTQYNALPQMNSEASKRDKTLEKIAAAQQLNMENAASRTIATMMQSDISGALQGLMNVNDGISMMQIANGTLTNLSQNTEHLNDISVKYNSAALNETQKQGLRGEFNTTVTAMQQAVDSTTFNGKSLFGNSMSFSLGEGTVTASLGNVAPQSLAIDNQSSIATYAQTIASAQSDVGSAINEFTSSSNTLLSKITNTSAAKSQIADTDMAKVISDFQSSNKILDASVLASAHQTQYLRESIGRLLG